MALPDAYLKVVKRVPDLLEAIRRGQAPDRFTQKYLESLGFASSNDRLFINVLKSLDFLDDQGQPTQRYHQYLDKTQSEAVLADAIRDAYSDLYQINRNAHEMSSGDVFNKMKTLSQGQYSDAVLQKMASTFKALASVADFSAEPAPWEAEDDEAEEIEDVVPLDRARPGRELQLGGLVYNIQIHLPESRDPAVYDALFRSLRQHLLR